jgi:hypothetical protein
MNECYKCGRELPDGQVECQPVCTRNGTDGLTDEDIADAIRNYEADTVQIDWDKVVTLEDLKLIMREVMYDDRIYKDSPAFETLKRFLKL